MRYLFILLSLASCHGLSRSDREYIRIRIESHNIAAQVNYHADLFEEKQMLILRYGKVPAEEINRFNVNWNNPYTMGRDTALTEESYFEFCRVHGLNPREYIDRLPDR